jgi:hypothetical protein
MSDSYFMVIKEGTEWRLRYGIRMESEWQPIEWTGSDLSYGIDIVTDAAFRFAEMPECTSDMNNLPVFDKLEKALLIKKCEISGDNWGIVVFQINNENYRDALWTCLTGYKEQLLEGEWATAEANNDLGVALAGLKPDLAAEAVVWQQDMQHRISARTAEGEITKYSIEEMARRRPLDKERNQVFSKRFAEWQHSEKWTTHLVKTRNECKDQN